MEHKILLKCRVCLDDVDEAEMFDLFPKKASGKLKLSENVEYCCGVTIRESIEMPSKMCIKCFDMTRMWYNFRQLCFNSQVYLESMCTDRPRPKGFNDSKYLEYLVDQLQILRWEACNETKEHDIGIESVDSENGDVHDMGVENCHDTSNDADESDHDLADIMQNIKKEQLEEAVERMEKENKTIEAKEAAAKEPTILQKKSSSTVKKRFRPPSPSSYMCSICGNVYTRKASFAYHMSIHRNDRPHECELCRKTFRQNSELKSHMRRHTGERPYKCTFCERHFIDRSEKHRHERVHTNNRPYICNVCGKSFMYSAILKNHAKLHTGEKDFNCLVCQKSFTLQHQLKAHLTTIIHKQKEEEFVGADYEVIYD